MRGGRRIRRQTGPFPSIENGSAVVMWRDEASRTPMLLRMIDETEKLRAFATMGSPAFGAAEGITLEFGILKSNDALFFEGSKRGDSVFFLGTKPLFSHSLFIDTMLDTFEDCGNISTIYTVSCIPAQTSHRKKRSTLYIFNSEGCRERFEDRHAKIKNKEFSTIPGLPQEPPSINLYVAWKAALRSIDCVNILVETPFYMSLIGDAAAEAEAARAVRKMLGRRSRLDKETKFISESQTAAIDYITQNSEDLKDYIEKIENGEILSIEEMQLMMSELGRVLETDK